jgi:hypothetical protein
VGPVHRRRPDEPEFHLTPSFPQLLLSNLTYWTTAYRPMGGIVYVAMYRLAGFHPMPFRVVCFALLLVNLWLLYRVCLRLTERREIAAAGDLAGDLSRVAGQPLLQHRHDLRTAVLRLLLRGLRLLPGNPAGGEDATPAAVDLVSWRSTSARSIPRNWRSRCPCASSATKRSGTGLKGSARGVAISAFVTLPYVIGKLTGPDSLAANPLYRPAISPARYLHTFHLYLNVLFYQDHFWRDANTILLVVAMLALGVWQRSRPLLFAWCFVLFSVLPFIFVPHYSGFFLYLPMAGWALYFATLIEMLRVRFAKAGFRRWWWWWWSRWRWRRCTPGSRARPCKFLHPPTCRPPK